MKISITQNPLWNIAFSRTFKNLKYPGRGSNSGGNLQGFQALSGLAQHEAQQIDSELHFLSKSAIVIEQAIQATSKALELLRAMSVTKETAVAVDAAEALLKAIINLK